MAKTTLLYFQDSYLFESSAKVVDIQPSQKGFDVILDQTIFHPQGGGQPSDVGEILNEKGAKLNVIEVKFDRETGIVHHIGEFENEKFEVNETVTLKVNQEVRRLHCRLHSAGHLLDSALNSLGYLTLFNLVPVKGYHFSSGPNVEYKGDIPTNMRDKVLQDLQEKMNQLIKSDGEVEVFQEISESDLNSVCNSQITETPNPSSEKKFRVIKMEGLGCPCGGTHVKKLSDIQSVQITKIKVNSSKKEVKISYKVD